MNSDSVDKIVSRYFAALAMKPFVYKGEEYEPKTLKVSPLLLRDYTCPPLCGGCCFRFTLDYIKGENMPDGVQKRMVEFNGKKIEVWTDPQSDNKSSRCRHLRPDDGRCGIYKVRPFSCDFELIRVMNSVAVDPKPNILIQKLFGRGWSYPRVDGGKGALCKMTDITPRSCQEVVRKLGRLRMWAVHFGLDTWASTIIGIIERGHLQGPIVLPPNRPHTFGL